MSGDWETNRRPAPWRRVVGLTALVLAALLTGVVAWPDASAPTLPLDVESPEEPEESEEAVAPERDAAYSGRWARMSGGPLSTREVVASAWTGDELLVWGGRVSGRGRWFSDGAAYDPATDRWRPLPASPLRARAGASAVWTGREFIVWGGAGAAGESVSPRGVVGAGVETAQTTQAFADGAAYNPRTNRWRRLPAAPLSPRRDAPMVWTGSQAVVWGGTAIGHVRHHPDGAAYDPAADRWVPIRGGPLGRRDNRLVQTAALDGRVLVWTSDYQAAATAVYDPAAGTWEQIPPPPLHAGAGAAMATVAGGVMMWGGWRFPRGRAVAVRYTTSTNRWITVSQPPYVPEPQQPLVAAAATAIAFQAGGGIVYDGVRDRWDRMARGPDLQAGAVQVWAGDRLLLWRPGGSPHEELRAASWRPGNPWQPLPDTPVSIDAAGATVWSGWLQEDQQVLVWGGLDHGSHDVGAAYDPAARTWEALPRSPLSRRVEPAAAWLTGEMVVVGGRDLPGAPPLPDAAAFAPSTRTWRRLPDAPMAVAGDAVAVAGDLLYAVGLRGGAVTAAAYHPAHDDWAELPAPPLRADVDRLHAVWTEFELWVWGTSRDGEGSGAAYSPRRGRWRTLPRLRGVTGALAMTWATTRMFVLAADGTTASLGRGAVQWQRYARSPLRTAMAAMAWNGVTVITLDPASQTAAALDPRASEWTVLPAPPLPAHQEGRLLWTGRDMYAFVGEAAAELPR